MKLFRILTIFICLIFATISCSTKKDAFLNRNYNSVKTNYNILYNGQLSYDEGLKAISEKHEDNFWKRLPIEAITFNDDDIEAPKFKKIDEEGNEEKNVNRTPFDIAEEKAVKAIQKHSMNIEGYEKNSKMDESYLLLGKSRYYTQRFIPAIEAYNYIIANYPLADLNYETKVWRAKANTRLGNEDRAIETMNLLLKVLDEKEEVSKRVQEEAYTAMAMAYAETDTIQKVIDNLKLATQTFINKEQSARNMFVLGQIYNELNRKDSARVVFQKLSDTRRAPRKYKVHANIELVKNFEKDTSSVELIKRFKKLIRNPDNREYLDELYYQIGVLEQNNGNIKQAISYFKESSLVKNASDYQKTYTYERLGNINFDQQNYLKASAYYDTILQISENKFDTEKRIRRIKRKNKNLLALREHENLIKNNDSILDIVAMSTNERTTYFEKYIEKLKKEDEERRQQLLNAQNFGNQFGNTIGANNKNASKWYFYSPQSKNFGEGEFKRIWGNRALDDNWRWSDKTSLKTVKEEEDKKENPRYILATYLNKIPSDTLKIAQLKDDRDESLFKLGIIYKEQFKNNSLALEKLERLERVNQKEEMNLPISYHLYQLYISEGNEVLANQKKNYILDNYADSKFAETIKYPNKKLIADDKKIDESRKIHKYIYSLYKDKQYEKALSELKSFQQNVNNSKLIPKLALIKALTIGKIRSKEEYLKELKYVAIKFANGIEGEKANEIIELLKNNK